MERIQGVYRAAGYVGGRSPAAPEFLVLPARVALPAVAFRSARSAMHGIGGRRVCCRLGRFIPQIQRSPGSHFTANLRDHSSILMAAGRSGAVSILQEIRSIRCLSMEACTPGLPHPGCSTDPANRMDNVDYNRMAIDRAAPAYQHVSGTARTPFGAWVGRFAVARGIRGYAHGYLTISVL